MNFIYAASFSLWFLLSPSTVYAGGLDDADKRLFNVQMSLADKGDARAQYHLGEMYEHGLGAEPNAEEAFKWYTKSAEKGNPMAKRKLAKRTEIEAEIRNDRAAEMARPEPVKPVVVAPPVEKKKPLAAKSATASAAAKEAQEAKHAEQLKVEAEEKARREQEKLAAEKAKRRAALRAAILDRIRNPVGAPFE